MSLIRILKSLEGFGLTKVESEVYIHLAKAGPSTAKDLSSALRISKQQLYPALKDLTHKGIVSSKAERTRLFSALAFEELLNLIMKISAEKATTVKETKQDLVSSWEDMVRQNNS